MKKNTILAFLIILVSINFFTSRFYYEKILGRRHPSNGQQGILERKGDVKAAEVDSAAADTTRGVVEERGAVAGVAVTDVARTVWGVDEAPASAARASSVVEWDTVWIETERVVCGISERGGVIVSLRIRDYRYMGGDRCGEEVELVGDSGVGGCNLLVNDRDYDKLLFVCADSAPGPIRVSGNERVSLVFRYEGSDGEWLAKEYTFVGEGYRIGYAVRAADLDGKSVVTGWLCGISDSEKGVGGGKSAQYDQRSLHLFDGRSVEYLVHKKAGREEKTGYYEWAGITSKYFLVALVPDSVRDADIGIETWQLEPPQTGGKKGGVVLNYRFRWKRFASGCVESYWVYAGPSKLTELKGTGEALQKVLFCGYAWFFAADRWFPVLCEFVLWLLVELHKLVKDYGVVIIILTVLSKVVTYPLTASSMKSMGKMRELQPRINKLREKHKGNPKKMNERLMAFYKEEGVSPLAGAGGCLPMIMQMPVFISLFVVLRKAIELRGAGTVLLPWVKDLSQAEALPVISPLPFVIPMYGDNVALLPIVMAVLTYFQNKATIKDPNQKAMVYFMPVFMLVLFNSFPSGLVLYWTFSSALGLVQQWYTDKGKRA